MDTIFRFSARTRGLALASFAVCALLCVLATPALATAPTVTLSGGAAQTVLYGRELPVSLTASAPAGQDFGYNLALREVLPAGVSYVAGSAGAQAGEPQIIANAPSTGQTTLIWSNLSDLSANSKYTLGFHVAIDQTKYDVGNTFQTTAGAYLSADPRYIAKFNADGTPNGPSATSFTTSATAGPATTTITAIQIEKSEPSPEGEIMRGVHDQQTVYTLKVTNNDVNPTYGVDVEDYLPAGLEFLGCGGANADHTSNAPTNPGSTEEYPGSGPITVPSLTGCVTPSKVETVQTDPDGSGPLPFAIYTHVVFPVLGTFAPSQVQTIKYRAAIPIRENTLSWSNLTPPDTGAQTANLDNNSGPETYDEQPLLNGARAWGLYKNTLAVEDRTTLLRTAEDLAVQKSGSSGTLHQGDITTWTLHIEASEYRDVSDVQVDDTLPNGLCPLDTANDEVTPPASAAECDPVSGKLPSAPYTSVAEHADGTWSLHWDKSTMPSLAHLAPNETRVITFPTRTRVHYQSNFADSTPVLANDGLTNNVTISGPDFTRTVNGTPIDHDETDGIPDTDVSGAGQSATGPVLDKRVAAALPLSGDCRDATYVTTVPSYRPGDQICWKLHIDFPAGLHTQSQGVTDFLPPGLSYVPGSEHTTATNTVPVSAVDTSTSGILRWTLGDANDYVANNGEQFDLVFATTEGSPDGHLSGDITGNLMKFSSANTPGQSFPLRDRADFVLSVPTLGLTKGVYKVNGAPSAGNAANTDHVSVQGGDKVTWRVDVKNTGTEPTTGETVWDKLPANTTCSDVDTLTISDGGTCDALNSRIVWTLTEAIAPGATKTLFYAQTIDPAASPGETWTNTAGVRSYTATDNQGGTDTFYPTGNIDTSVPAGSQLAPAAKDTSDVFTPAATNAKAQTTSVTETGNNAASQATIGEVVTYTVTTVVPQGTTLYGTPTVTDTLNSRLALVPGSASATLNGVALPTSGLSIAEGANSVTTTFPATYANASNSGADTLVMTFKATVLDVATNKRSATIPNVATLAYKDERGGAHTLNTNTVNTTIVEPNLTLAKSHTGGLTVSPGQIVPFTVTATDPTAPGNVSPAHEVVVTDTVPAGLTPVDGSGNPIADGGTVPSDGGIWDATARTITWTTATILPGGSAPFHASLQVESPSVAGKIITNQAAATTTSLAGTVTGERTATTAAALSPPVGGYAASASDPVKLALPSITKTVTPDPVTVGDKVTWTLHVTLPKNLQYYDTTVVDTVPDGFDVDGPGATAGTTWLTPVVNGNGTTTAAFYIGDLPPSASDRTYDLEIKGHLRATHRSGGANVVNGQTQVNSALVDTNRTDKVSGTPASVPASFDDATTPATATSHVVEPSVSIVKSADKGPYVVAGDHVTYTLKVTNSGTSPAYDVTVDDTPHSDLTNVQLAAGVSTTANTDGWTAGDPHMRWFLAGPIAVGGSVTLTYTADVKPSSALHAADHITNTASIPTYYGVPTVTRTADGFVYRQYAGNNSTVTLLPDFPTLSLVKTTGASGFPDSAPAETGQGFTWRIVVTNTSHVATAKDVDVVDTLPKNWAYVPGTSSTGTDPSIASAASGDVLTFGAVATLAPGASKTVTFQAKPLAAAKTDPGSGPSHPHVNTAIADASDSTGATGNADGPYKSNSDTAQAILQLPGVLTVKTPDHGAAVAGTDSSFTIKVTNTGLGTARTVKVTDTLPAGLTYSAGAATASPSTGFSESGVSGSTITWMLGAIAPGATTTITVPVHVAANVADGTTLVNTATAHDDDAPADSTDTGSLDVAAKTDLTITKTDSPDPVYQGTNLTYTLTAKNNGPSDAQNVSMTDPLPAHVSYVSSSPDCAVAAGTVTCTVGTLAANATKAETIVVHVEDTYSGNLHNSAHVSTTTTETNTTNNDASADTTVLKSGDVSITKTADHTHLNGGDQVVYTLTAHNNGPGSSVGVVITDPLPAELEFVSADGGCTVAGAVGAQTVTCPVGTLAVGADAVVHVTARARGTAASGTPGTGDHLIPITKVEQQVDLDAGQTRTVDLTCDSGGIMSDGSARVDAVDQGTGTLADVKVLAAHSTALDTYRFVLRNDATGRAQAKVFGVCLPPRTSAGADGHTHSIDVGALLTQSADLAVGKHTFHLDCGCGHVAVAPGFEFTSGAGRVVTSENDGTGWKFVVDVTQPAHVTVSVRPMSDRTGVTNGHAHMLDLRFETQQVTIPAGRTVEAQVICDDDAKGIVATYDLPDGVVLLGHDPRPKTRVFKLMNTTNTDQTATVDLVCLGDRTGPEVDPDGNVINTAHVSSESYDPNLGNNDASVCLEISRAPGTLTTTPAAPTPAPATDPGPATAPTTVATPAKVRLATTRVGLAADRGVASVSLTCAAQCSGTVTLTLPKGGKRVTVGHATFRRTHSGKVVVRVHIAKRYRSLLRGKAATSARVRIVVGKTTIVRHVSLRRTAP